MRFAILTLLFVSMLLGCVKRTISITSTPPGALVWVNEREFGRTPVEVDFLYYGEYSVRVEGEGFEPIMTTRWTQMPVWDAPFIDLGAELVPITFYSNTSWHFDLEEPNNNPDLLLNRANDFRAYTRTVGSE
jgi:hypothetical protein